MGPTLQECNRAFYGTLRKPRNPHARTRDARLPEPHQKPDPPRPPSEPHITPAAQHWIAQEREELARAAKQARAGERAQWPTLRELQYPQPQRPAIQEAVPEPRQEPLPEIHPEVEGLAADYLALPLTVFKPAVLALDNLEFLRALEAGERGKEQPRTTALQMLEARIHALTDTDA